MQRHQVYDRVVRVARLHRVGVAARQRFEVAEGRFGCGRCRCGGFDARILCTGMAGRQARVMLAKVARSTPPTLGEFIRRQREINELSMRQLARMVGISNPYLSQIERGLREPSDRVLEAIADNLELSAEALKQFRPRPAAGASTEESAVVAAIRADPDLGAKERAALIEVYELLVARKH